MGEMKDLYGAYPDLPGWNPFDGEYDGTLFECVNCDETFEAVKWPYLFCSELCQQEGQYVRAYRRYRKDGSIDRPDMAEAMQTRLSMILGGGYPAQARRLSPAAREAAFVHDGRACRLCGEPATDIDHIGQPIDGDINHPDNLQALCKDCHRKKTAASFRVVTRESDPEEWLRCQEKVEALMARVDSLVPVRPCDDEDSWKGIWRHLAKERKAETRL